MERVTIRDVAKKAGVSITTVSKALNDYSDVNPETRQKIKEIAEKLNYVPNAAGRSRNGGKRIRPPQSRASRPSNSGRAGRTSRTDREPSEARSRAGSAPRKASN